MKYEIKEAKILVEMKFDPAKIQKIKMFHTRKWNPKIKKWEFPFTEEAVLFLIRNFGAHSVLTNSMNEEKNKTANIIEAKKSTDPIEGVELKRKLFPYQWGAVRFMREAKKGIIADDMGTGKTTEAISWALSEGMKTVLVVCPAYLRFVWEEEIGKCSDAKIKILLKTKDRPIYPAWNICSYSYAAANKDALKTSTCFDGMIVDEASYIKNKKSSRGKAIRQLGHSIEKVALLTGTPMLNAPKELWNLLDTVAQGKWGSDFSYGLKYCGGHQKSIGRMKVWDFSGASNIDELRDKLRPYMIRRTRKQVAPEIPEKTRMVMKVELSPKNRAEYEEAKDRFYKWLKDTYEDGVTRGIRAKNAEALVIPQYMKKICVEDKLEALKVFLNDNLDTGPKMGVFSSYRGPIEDLQNTFGDKCVHILGGDKNRQETVNRYQTDDKCRLFASTIKAGGMGITLTAGAVCVFLDLDWVPAMHWQAEDRFVRHGQKEKVQCIYLIAKDTIEETIYNLLLKKEEIFKKIIDGNEVKNSEKQGKIGGSIMEDFLMESMEKAFKR